MSNNVVISPNIQKSSERIDQNGNVIDKLTKQVIEPKQQEYIPPQSVEVPVEAHLAPVFAPQTTETPKSGTLSIQEQINATEAKLNELKEAKKQQIEEMKKQLLELENS